MKKILLLSILSLFSTICVYAYDFVVAGIYYYVNNDGSTVTVVYKSYNDKGYSGNVTIPNQVSYEGVLYSVTSIGSQAFAGCSGVTSIIIPNSVTSIGNFAFSDCCGLKSITISNSVTTIENGTFYNCSGLTSITIPNSVISIRNSAFFACSGLTSLTIPNSVISIEDGAFSNCSGLTELTIGNSVTDIGGEVFRGCSGLTSIIIPNSVININNSAFLDCSELKNVVLEDGTMTLSFVVIDSHTDYIFGYCPIESLYLGRNISYSPFRYKPTLTSIIIGNSVTSIGDNAFSGCSGLTELIIGNSVTSIGDYAFGYCSKLMEINSKNPNPPDVQSNTFASVNKEMCIVYVPVECATSYMLHSVWQEFFNIREKDFSSVAINNIVSESEIVACINHEGIKLIGCNPVDKVSIYTINGLLIYNSVIGNGLISCPLQKGIYIIHTPKKSIKVFY